MPRQTRGERVEVPTAELLGTTKTDWGKVGVWLAVGTFVFGVIVTIIWNYADAVNSIRNLGDDVKELKRKTDELLRSSLDAGARLSSLERRAKDEAVVVVPPASAPSAVRPR
jgi:hypothetical protein